MIDALVTAWDWIKANYKEILVALLIIVLVIIAIVLIVKASALIAAGSVITIFTMTISPKILSFIGYGILIGGGFNGLVSWLSGNEFMSLEMLTDILFGGIAGGVGGLAGAYAGGARFVTWLGGKFPRLSRFFPALFEGSVGAGVEQSVFDFLKTGKINIKNTVIVFGLGGLLSLGGWYFFDNFGSIASSINKIEFPYVQMQVMESADSGLKIPSIDVGKTKIEDTKFGAWLKKFSAGNEGNANRTERARQLGSIQWNSPNFRGVDNEENLLREFERLNIEIGDIPDIVNRLTNPQKGVLGEYFMDKRMTALGFEKLPSKTGGRRNNGIDGLYIRRNEQGDIVSIVVVESKWNTSTYGSAWYTDPNNNDERSRVKQMSLEWINQKARDMISSGDPATAEAGRMLNMALNNRRYRGD